MILILYMHYCVFVLTDPRCDPEDAVEAALTPFNEQNDVEPYRVYLSHDEVVRMAARFGLVPADLHALALKMPEWTGCRGGVDREGLYYLSSCNPDGRWDWYEIGGRWDGYIPRSRNNTIIAGTLARSASLSRCLPCFLLTPEGDWLEHERFYFLNNLENSKTEKLEEQHWFRIVQEALSKWPKYRVVCVDVHS